MFSLLFEVADESFTVAVRRGGVVTGGVLQKSGGFRGQGRGGHTPGTGRLNEVWTM